MWRDNDKTTILFSRLPHRHSSHSPYSRSCSKEPDVWFPYVKDSARRRCLVSIQSVWWLGVNFFLRDLSHGREDMSSFKAQGCEFLSLVVTPRCICITVDRQCDTDPSVCQEPLKGGKYNFKNILNDCAYFDIDESLTLSQNSKKV